MPAQPHPITVTLNDTDNATLVSGGKVLVRNTTKKSTSSIETTDAAGIAIIDLANLPLTPGQTNEYDPGDEVFIVGYKGHNHDAARYVVAGQSKDQTLNLNPVPFITDDAINIMEITTGNTSGSVAYLKVYSFKDGQMLCHIETPANDSKNVIFGPGGKKAGGGFVIEREATGLLVTATIK
ncbi:hypothetical protein HY469_03510 [Candidatus Roizmanbacteria bacterium]|nr:hypothetical protein [Candidatus Roizmanbacteria bacterium]